MTKQRIVVSILTIAIVATHTCWLPWVVRPLDCAPASTVGRVPVVIGGDRVCELAIELANKLPQRAIVVHDSAQERVNALKVLPTSATRLITRLDTLGFDPAPAETLASSGWTVWDTARDVAHWLDHHPRQSVVVLESQFRTRAMQSALS